MVQSRCFRVRREYRTRRASQRQIQSDQCVDKGVGVLLTKLNQLRGWILLGCECGCEVVPLQPHVCTDRMASLKLLVVAPP